MHIATRVMPSRVLRVFDKKDADLGVLLSSLERAPYYAFDTEWFSYDASNKQTPVHNGLPFCATFAWWEKPGVMHGAIVHAYGDGAWDNLDILADHGVFDSDKPKIAHNYPVDWHVLRNAGIEMEGPAWDTLVLSWLFNENRGAKWSRAGHGLKELVGDYAGVKRVDFTRTFGRQKLRKDGQPYSNDQWDVPKLEDWWAETLSCSDEEREDRISRYANYAVDDASDALWLFEFFKASKRLNMPWGPDGKTVFDLFLTRKAPETRMICEIERAGMPVDREFMAEMIEVATKDRDNAESVVASLAQAPVNVGSAKQMSHLVYGTGELPVKKGKRVLYTIHGMGYPPVPGTETDTGAGSVSYDALKALRKKLQSDGKEVPPALTAIQEYKRADSQLGKIEEIMTKLVGDRIHGRLNQIGTIGGRYSSAGPNLQNIVTGDKDVYNARDTFHALADTMFVSPSHGTFVEDGALVVADFSQLEYRLLSHFTQDPQLLQAFRSGWDMHSLTTLRVFPEVTQAYMKHFGTTDTDPTKLKWVAHEFENVRKKGKVLNFEIIYGVGPTTLALQLGISQREAQAMLDGWYKAYPQVRVWMDAQIKQAVNIGYSRTLLGRYRWPDKDRITGSRGRSARGEEERSFCNSLIQGSAADMTMQSMLRMREDEQFVNTGARMIMQVHDEVIVECPWTKVDTVVERMRIIMEQPFSRPLRVPMPVSIGVGPSWATAKCLGRGEARRHGG